MRIGSLKIDGWKDIKKGIDSVKRDGIKKSLKTATDWRTQVRGQKKYEKHQAASNITYRDISFHEAVQRAGEVADPVQRLHDLNAVKRRINEYLATGSTVGSKGIITNAIRTPFKARNSREVAKHRDKMYALQTQIDKLVDETVENNVEAISKHPNKVWVLSPPRVALKFALAASDIIVKVSAENEAAPTGKHHRPPQSNFT